jgi:hypothetical protein
MYSDSSLGIDLNSSSVSSLTNFNNSTINNSINTDTYSFSLNSSEMSRPKSRSKKSKKQRGGAYNSETSVFSGIWDGFLGTVGLGPDSNDKVILEILTGANNKNLNNLNDTLMANLKNPCEFERKNKNNIIHLLVLHYDELNNKEAILFAAINAMIKQNKICALDEKNNDGFTPVDLAKQIGLKNLVLAFNSVRVGDLEGVKYAISGFTNNSKESFVLPNKSLEDMSSTSDEDVFAKMANSSKKSANTDDSRLTAFEAPTATAQTEMTQESVGGSSSTSVNTDMVVQTILNKAKSGPSMTENSMTANYVKKALHSAPKLDTTDLSMTGGSKSGGRRPLHTYSDYIVGGFSETLTVSDSDSMESDQYESIFEQASSSTRQKGGKRKSKSKSKSKKNKLLGHATMRIGGKVYNYSINNSDLFLSDEETNTSSATSLIGGMIKNKTSEIHDAVLQQIKDMLGVNELTAKVYKAILYKRVKDMYADLSGYERAVEMQKMVTEENLRNIDINSSEASEIMSHLEEKAKQPRPEKKEKKEKKLETTESETSEKTDSESSETSETTDKKKKKKTKASEEKSSKSKSSSKSKKSK